MVEEEVHHTDDGRIHRNGEVVEALHTEDGHCYHPDMNTGLHRRRCCLNDIRTFHLVVHPHAMVAGRHSTTGEQGRAVKNGDCHSNSQGLHVGHYRYCTVMTVGCFHVRMPMKSLRVGVGVHHRIDYSCY